MCAIIRNSYNYILKAEHIHKIYIFCSILTNLFSHEIIFLTMKFEEIIHSKVCIENLTTMLD